jgi:ribosomal-protein-alanine N-acetyltransferase
MRDPDLPLVAALHRASMHSPWTEAGFADSLAAGHRCLVSCAGGRIVGCAVSRQVVDQAELLTIATAADARRQGIARDLLTALFIQYAATGVRQCTLEVMVGNAAALAFYRQFRFREIGRRPGYYRLPDGNADGLLMQADLTGWCHEAD